MLEHSPRSIQPRKEVVAVQRVVHGAVGDRELHDVGFAAGEVVDFSVNSNPLGPSPRVMETLGSVDIARYPDDSATDLRLALGSLFALQPDQILVGNGSAEILWLIALAYVRPGDVVALFGPTFGEYERVAHLMGGRVETLRTRASERFHIDLAAARRWLQDLRPRLVFLCNPNNPTGTYLGLAQIQEIVEASGDALVVIDEAYAGLLRDQAQSDLSGLRALLPLLQRENVVLVRSLTKDCALAGLRLGYALAPAGIADVLGRVKPPWSVNRAAQAAGLAALADGAHLEAGRQLASHAVGLMQEGFREQGRLVFDTAANFFLVEIGSGSQVRSDLLRHGLVVRDCASFGLPSIIRVAARPLPDCERLIKAMAQLQLVARSAFPTAL